MKSCVSVVLSALLLCLGHFAVSGERDKSCPMPAPPIGDELGRGGGVVVCRDEYRNLRTIELFDYWEQRSFRNLIHRSPNTTDPVDSAKQMLYLVRIFSPQRAQAYERFADRFMQQVQWTNKDIDPINDICPEVRIPTGCEFDQLIVRRNSVPSPGGKLFLVNRQLWDAMIVPYQGGAILHEAFYEEAIRAGHTNSRKARYFNVLMHSHGAEKMTDLAYIQSIRSADFPFWEFRQAFQRSLKDDGNDAFTGEQLKFNSNEELTSIEAREGARLELFHPLLGLKSGGTDVHNGHYSLFVKQILFTRERGQQIVRAVLDQKTVRGSPYVLLKGQWVELAVPGEIAVLNDSALRLKLASCYRDPRTQQNFCGEIVLNSAGVVLESR